MDIYAIRREIALLLFAFWALVIFGILAWNAPRCLEKPHSGIFIGGIIRIAGCQ